MEKRLKIRIFCLLSLIFLIIFLLFYLFNENRKNLLTVSFLDIGQGDAIFIDAPNGNQILIDAGRDRSVLRKLSDVMSFYDKKIDILVATHGDQDHIGGMPDVLNKYKIDLFIETNVFGKSATYDELSKILSENKIKKLIIDKKIVLDMGDNVYLYILFPDRNVSGMETNTASIVAKLVYGESEFLLTGDSPKQIEEYLVNKSKNNLLGVDVYGNYINLKSDVLKLGHHGSKTSTSPIFINEVMPKYAVVSAGKDNSYGHPHKEVLEVLEKNKVPILGTYSKGNIVFESDGNRLFMID